MISGRIDQWKTHPGFADHPVWSEAFGWIEKFAAKAEEGIRDLSAEGCRVRVMSYELLDRVEAKFESHRHTVDLQYSIEGGEGIEVIPTVELHALGEYLSEKDFQFHQTPGKEGSFIRNVAGNFAVLFPSDGHQPKRLIDGCSSVKKLVVKIPVKMITPAVANHWNRNLQ